MYSSMSDRCCERNESWRRFCVYCGKRLGAACARCGAVHDAEATTCAGCGAHFLPQREAEEPEQDRFSIPFW